MGTPGPGWGADKIFGGLFVGEALWRIQGKESSPYRKKCSFQFLCLLSTQRSDIWTIQRLFSCSSYKTMEQLSSRRNDAVLLQPVTYCKCCLILPCNFSYMVLCTICIMWRCGGAGLSDMYLLTGTDNPLWCSLQLKAASHFLSCTSCISAFHKEVSWGMNRFFLLFETSCHFLNSKYYSINGTQRGQKTKNVIVQKTGWKRSDADFLCIVSVFFLSLFALFPTTCIHARLYSVVSFYSLVLLL